METGSVIITTDEYKHYLSLQNQVDALQDKSPVFYGCTTSPHHYPWRNEYKIYNAEESTKQLIKYNNSYEDKWKLDQELIATLRKEITELKLQGPSTKPWFKKIW